MGLFIRSSTFLKRVSIKRKYIYIYHPSPNARVVTELVPLTLDLGRGRYIEGEGGGPSIMEKEYVAIFGWGPLAYK